MDLNTTYIIVAAAIIVVIIVIVTAILWHNSKTKNNEILNIVDKECMKKEFYLL